MIGTYVLRDDIHLATPPPHPSEAPVQNNNPLATTVGPPTAGTLLSLVTLVPRQTQIQPQQHVRYSTSNSTGIDGSQDGSQDYNDATSSPRKSGIADFGRFANGSTPAFGSDNPALHAVNGKPSKDPLKKVKPKNNIVKSNSSFVSRVIPHDALQKRLQDRPADGLFCFANINRSFQWLDLSSEDKKEEPLAKILFTKAHALCHDINPVSKGPSHLDIVMGFSTSDLIWYEPLSQKYARLNKNGMINPSPVSEVRWMPHSENLFLAAHMDGSLVVYDKEKEDAPFVPEDAPNGLTNGHYPSLQTKKSVQSKSQKTNPVAYYKISSQKINAFAFSPDARHLAVVSEDGSFRVVDFLREAVVDLYTSYYGGFVSVCWSPDGQYIVTGGQDDLVSIWSLADAALVARCHGHNSWVTGVAFDPWRCDDRTYRFGSVGEDCRLLLWDFNVSMLHRPRAAAASSVHARARGSVSSTLPVAATRTRTGSGGAKMGRSESALSYNPDGLGQGMDEVVHPVEPRARTAVLPPVLAKQVDEHPMASLTFEEDCIVTSCRDGKSNLLCCSSSSTMPVWVSTVSLGMYLASSGRRVFIPGPE